MVNIGINGFGRIGRIVTRLAIKKGVDIFAINDPHMPLEYMAYLLRHDSVHGKFDGRICIGDNFLLVNSKKILVLNKSEPESIQWGNLGVEYVIESTGDFTTLDQAKAHLESGAKKVIVTAPSNDIPMFVCGVNLDKYKSDMNIVSNASCTTNCLAPLAKVIHENFGIEQALMTTVHAVTESQKPVDMVSKKAWRNGRSCLQNIIPASTGAAKAVAQVIPELEGKITGMAFRVPVANVSVVDLTCVLEKSTDIESIRDCLVRSSKTFLRGIIGVTDESVVSMDFNCDERSSIFDVNASLLLNSNFVKLIAWYDNEYGYSARVIDLLKHMCEVDKSAENSYNQDVEGHNMYKYISNKMNEGNCICEDFEKINKIEETRNRTNKRAKSKEIDNGEVWFRCSQED